MMRRIENDNTDNIDYVLVFKLSRFGRNADDILQELRIMQRYGVNLLAVEERIDSAGPTGRLMASMGNALQMLRLVQDKFPLLPDATKKRVFQEMLESVEIFEQRQPDGRQVKAIHFRFPVTIEGETSKDWWYSQTQDDTVIFQEQLLQQDGESDLPWGLSGNGGGL